jgi:hypothetical protein
MLNHFNSLAIVSKYRYINTNLCEVKTHLYYYLLLLLMVYLHIIALKMNYKMLTWKYTKIYKNTKI